MLRKIGITGGLKKIEQHFNLDREHLTNISGKHAVYLWKKYKSTKNEEYLTTLLAYNSEDVLNLPFLLIYAYNHLMKQKYSLEKCLNQFNYKITNPYIPSTKIIKEIN